MRNSIEINCNASAYKLPIHANLKHQVATKQMEMDSWTEKNPKSQKPKASKPNPLLSNCCALEAWSVPMERALCGTWRHGIAGTDELLRHGPANWAWLAALADPLERHKRNADSDGVGDGANTPPDSGWYSGLAGSLISVQGIDAVFFFLLILIFTQTRSFRCRFVTIKDVRIEKSNN